MIGPQVREWPLELQLPTREIGPREEPERHPTRFIVNDGQWTPAEHEEELHKASQAWHPHAWNREAREEAERHNQEFNRSMADWKREVESRGFKDHPAVPHGPPPIGDLQPYTVTTKGLSSWSGIFRGCCTNWKNLREQQNIHHPQDCTSDLHHDFCRGGARIVRFDS